MALRFNARASARVSVNIPNPLARVQARMRQAQQRAAEARRRRERERQERERRRRAQAAARRKAREEQRKAREAQRKARRDRRREGGGFGLNLRGEMNLGPLRLRANLAIGARRRQRRKARRKRREERQKQRQNQPQASGNPASQNQGSNNPASQNQGSGNPNAGGIQASAEVGINIRPPAARNPVRNILRRAREMAKKRAEEAKQRQQQGQNQGSQPPRDRTVPCFKIKIDGQELPQDVQEKVAWVVTDDAVNMAGMFRIRLENADARMSENELFKVGATVEIEKGYTGTTKPVIKGEITGMKARFASYGPRYVDIIGYETFHKLTRVRRTKTWTNTPLKAIIEEIAGEVGLQPDVSGEAVTRPVEYICQRNETHAEFLFRWSRLLGFDVDVKFGKLCCNEPSVGESSKKTYEWQKDLKKFAPVLNTITQKSEVTARGWDPLSKRPISEKASADTDEWGKLGGSMVGGKYAEGAFGNSSIHLVGVPFQSTDEAKAAAKGVLNNRAMEFLTAQAEVVGDEEMAVRDVVEIKGVGKLFEGTYYVTGVKHKLVVGAGYRTILQLKRTTVGVGENPDIKFPKAPAPDPNAPRPPVVDGTGPGGGGGGGGGGGSTDPQAKQLDELRKQLEELQQTTNQMQDTVRDMRGEQAGNGPGDAVNNNGKDGSSSSETDEFDELADTARQIKELAQMAEQLRAQGKDEEADALLAQANDLIGDFKEKLVNLFDSLPDSLKQALGLLDGANSANGEVPTGNTTNADQEAEDLQNTVDEMTAEAKDDAVKEQLGKVGEALARYQDAMKRAEEAAAKGDAEGLAKALEDAKKALEDIKAARDAIAALDPDNPNLAKLDEKIAALEAKTKQLEESLKNHADYANNVSDAAGKKSDLQATADAVAGINEALGKVEEALAKDPPDLKAAKEWLAKAKEFHSLLGERLQKMLEEDPDNPNVKKLKELYDKLGGQIEGMESQLDAAEEAAGDSEGGSEGDGDADAAADAEAESDELWDQILGGMDNAIGMADKLSQSLGKLGDALGLLGGGEDGGGGDSAAGGGAEDKLAELNDKKGEAEEKLEETKQEAKDEAKSAKDEAKEAKKAAKKARKEAKKARKDAKRKAKQARKAAKREAKEARKAAKREAKEARQAAKRQAKAAKKARKVSNRQAKRARKAARASATIELQVNANTSSNRMWGGLRNAP